MNAGPQRPPSSGDRNRAQDQEPLKVLHGRQIMKGIGKSQQAIEESRTTNQKILDLLTTEEGETDSSPLLEAMQQSLETQRQTQVLLNQILQRLNALDEQVSELVKK